MRQTPGSPGGAASPLTTRGDLYTRGASADARLALIAKGRVYGSDGTDIVAVAAPIVFDFRLTLTTATPVTTADVVGATTIYLSPYCGNRLTVLDASDNPYTIASAEVSLALSGLTASKNYDVWVRDVSGTLTLDLSAAWTNDTTRADAIARVAGIWSKSADHTRRLVGTIRATGATTTNDVGFPAAGTAPTRLVWNCNNRLLRPMFASFDSSSYNYSTDTYRAVNASAANRLDYVAGLSDDSVFADVLHYAEHNTSATGGGVGVGIDSTSVNSAKKYGGLLGQTGGGRASPNAHAAYAGYPGIGFHYLQALETAGSAGATLTWYPVPSSNDSQMGILGWVMG